MIEDIASCNIDIVIGALSQQCGIAAIDTHHIKSGVAAHRLIICNTAGYVKAVHPFIAKHCHIAVSKVETAEPVI